LSLKSSDYEITSLDPLVFGEGRPFSAAEGALERQSHAIPPPGTLAGAFFSCMFEKDWRASTDGGFSAPGNSQIRGPVLAIDGSPCFALPADALPILVNGEEHVTRLRPGRPAQNGDWPLADLRECEAVLSPAWGFVKDSELRLMPLAAMQKWLLDKETREDAQRAEAVKIPKLQGPTEERRESTAIDLFTQKAQDSRLFAVSGHRYSERLLISHGSEAAVVSRVSLCARTHLPVEAPPLFEMHLGGENRIAVCRKREDEFGGLFTCPEPLVQAFSRPGLRHIKLILATPASFDEGWKASWMDGSQVCPYTGGKFRLVAACLRRREFVSGWGLGPMSHGPKPMKWLAPAGSVYFLEVVEEPKAGLAASLAEAWLQPVSSNSSDRRRGYGLALWGTWLDHPKTEL
jgi:CRISPR-associated protein Cmr3